jgi:Flp pilus assembly protein TadD
MKIQCTLVLLGVLCLSAADVKWIKLKSPNFEMYTTAGERNARDTLRYFEQVRAFFVQAMGSIPGKALPVRIVAFTSKKEYDPYRINNFATAFYHSTGTSEGIVLGDIGSEVFPVAIHEYVHLVVRHAGLNLPPWLDEGLAELYSTLKPTADKIVVGNLVPGRYEALLQEKWVPLAVIVAAGHDSPYYNEKNQAGSLYNEGWAFTHMLVLNSAYRGNVAKFISLVNAGTPTADALKKVYGKTVADFDKELQAYLHGSHFQGVVFSQKLEKIKDEIPAEAASPFDVKLMLADLLNRPGKEQETQSAMERLAAENPQRPEPFAALGYLAWRKQDTPTAVKNFETAFALGGRDPSMLWDYGRLVRERNKPEAIRALTELLAQQPSRNEVRLELAAVQLISRQPDAALETLQPVKKVSPDEAPRLFLLLAHAQADAGHTADARENAHKLQQYANTDEDKLQAQQILQYLDSLAKAPALPPTSTSPDERPTLQRHAPPPLDAAPPVSQNKSIPGTFVAFDCSGPNPQIILNTAQGKKAFLIDDPHKVLGETIELTCGPQPKPAPVTIEFIPSAQPGVDGLVRRIQFAR